MRGSIRGSGITRTRSLTMATDVALDHAQASADLSPRLTAAEAVVKFMRTKPIGAAGAVIIVAMLLVPSVVNVVIAISIPIIPRAARVVRATALSVKENVYVEAVNALGATHPRVVLRHIIPNVVAPFIIIVTAQLGGAILAEAALS